MRPLTRTTLAVATVAVLGAPLAAARADQPQTFDDTFGFTAAPGELCDFAVDFTVHDVGWSTVVGTGQGSRETDHVTETDTMAANGRSITGEPYTYSVQRTFDASGDQVVLQAEGITWVFVLPDGTRVQAAGYANWLTGTSHGRPADLAPVCAYLAG